jgi:NAD(P)-dependent dehydrogenase (short-subunit alcohol dehydrogenase family)
MQAKLNGKIAIVTGSDSGIGQAIAEEFAKKGADIMVVYLHDRGGAAETRERVEAAGRRAIVSHTDVRNEHSVAKLFEETERKLGTPYILVNNAGVGTSGVPVADTTTEEWENVLKTPIFMARFSAAVSSSISGGTREAAARSSISRQYMRRSRAPAMPLMGRQRAGCAISPVASRWSLRQSASTSSISLRDSCARQ